MKKVLWMLLAVAVLGCGMSVMAKEKAAGDKAKPAATTVNGTIKVDGEKITLASDDGSTYVLKGKSVADLKSKDGQKLELKGKVSEEGGTKILTLAAGKGEGHGKKKDAGAMPGGDKK